MTTLRQPAPDRRVVLARLTALAPRVQRQGVAWPRQWQYALIATGGLPGGAPTACRPRQGYKPLTLDSIARWLRLGVELCCPPRCEKQAARRLILRRVFDGGFRVVAFHGRAYLPDDTDAKWLTAGGSSKQVLFNIDLVRPGATR